MEGQDINSRRQRSIGLMKKILAFLFPILLPAVCFSAIKVDSATSSSSASSSTSSLTVGVTPISGGVTGGIAYDAEDGSAKYKESTSLTTDGNTVTIQGIANDSVLVLQNQNSTNTVALANDSNGHGYEQLKSSQNIVGVQIHSLGTTYFIGGNVGIGTTN